MPFIPRYDLHKHVKMLHITHCYTKEFQFLLGVHRELPKGLKKVMKFALKRSCKVIKCGP